MHSGKGTWQTHQPEQQSNSQQDIIMTFATKLITAVLFSTVLAAPLRAENTAVKAMQEYMEFTPYEAGIIVPQQLAKDVFESVRRARFREHVTSNGARCWRASMKFQRTKKSSCSATRGVCPHRPHSRFEWLAATMSSCCKPASRAGKRTPLSNREGAPARLR
jgi:hypothetical protein